MGISEERQEKHLFILQQTLSLQPVLRVVADHWVCVLSHHTSDIHQVISLLTEARLLHAKFKIMTTLSFWYLSYNCETGHLQLLVWRTRHEAGAMLWRAISKASPLEARPCSIPSLFGGYFSFPQSRHLLHWLFHYYTHFSCKQASPKLAGVHHKRTLVPFLLLPGAGAGKGHSGHGQSLGTALQRLQLWDRAVLSSQTSPHCRYTFFGGGRGMWEEVWVFGLVWAFSSVVVLKKFTTNIQTKPRDHMSGSLGVQGTANQTSIYS